MLTYIVLLLVLFTNVAATAQCVKALAYIVAYIVTAGYVGCSSKNRQTESKSLSTRMSNIKRHVLTLFSDLSFT